MAASVPGVIENVRVADISQGNNPIRILSMRALPDSHVQDIKDEQHRQNEKTTDPEELAANEQAGSFYNLEVAIAYHAKPSGQDIASKAKNMGMQLVFYLGIKGLFGVPLPIWVELQGLVATARIRLQLTPDPPFLKTLTFTLMGIPKDQRGSKGGGSDPYITISWSKFSKPQFCTRVIQDDLNPVFEESAGLLVTADLLKADEQLSVELWDSDRSSADDVVGKVELSIQKLIQHPG